MGKIRTLIVDDEAAARRRIRRFLSELPEAEAVGECESGPEAVAAIEALAPDLLFLDVQMPRMSGFEVIERVGAGRVPGVVFVTAYDQFAVRAFEVHALDYILKPFDRQRFRRAFERARVQLEDTQAACLGRRLRGLLDHLRGGTGEGFPCRLEVKSGGRTVFIPAAEIDWVGAADNYLELHVGKETRLIRETMSQLEARLRRARFARVHRSTLVNLDRVRELRPLFNKDHLLILRDGTQLTVSRTYYERLLSLLRGD
jgi:two-component system LytT family response regulator